MNLQALVSSAMAALPSGTTGTVTFKRSVGGVYDRPSDSMVGAAPQTFAVGGVPVLPAKADELKGLGSAISLDKVRKLVVPGAACSWEPETNQSCNINGEEWGIIKTNPLKPDGVTLLMVEVWVSR